MASTIFFCPIRLRAVVSLVSIGLPDCGTEPVADWPAVRSPADEATAQPAKPASASTTTTVIGAFHENFRGATTAGACRRGAVPPAPARAPVRAGSTGAAVEPACNA